MYLYSPVSPPLLRCPGTDRRSISLELGVTRVPRQKRTNFWVTLLAASSTTGYRQGRGTGPTVIGIDRSTPTQRTGAGPLSTAFLNHLRFSSVRLTLVGREETDMGRIPISYLKRTLTVYQNTRRDNVHIPFTTWDKRSLGVELGDKQDKTGFATNVRLRALKDREFSSIHSVLSPVLVSLTISPKWVTTVFQ